MGFIACAGRVLGKQSHFFLQLEAKNKVNGALKISSPAGYSWKLSLVQ